MSQRKKDLHRPPEDALWFLPLGGSGEIGMNLNLYGTSGKWLMVDCGVTFPDETTPGIEIIMPDPTFIEERKDDLVGLVITHGHEDHLGAIEYLLPKLKCPVYATPFCAEIIRAKLAQAGIKGQVRLIELPVRGSFEAGPFKVEMIYVTHSVPESHMVAITTQHGTVLHTGDWKFDPDPIVGPVTDEDRLKELGREGILAVVGDSTNAVEAMHSGSELSVQKCFRKIFKNYKKRIVVTCFSSSIARLKSISIAAKESGRYVGLVGRSLWRNAEIAQSCGYLPEFSEFLSEHEAMQAPRDKIVMVSTGCQGEPRSALSRIAGFDHPEVQLDGGDTVIFSSRTIPGNEKSVGRIQNLLIKQGIDIVTHHHAPVHVSGHAAQEDMKQLYEWVKPRLSVPVHGELRHQNEHAKIARAAGVPDVLIPADGQILRLGPGVHEVVGEVQIGRLGMDGKVLRAIDQDAVKNRRKLGFSGAAVVMVALNSRGDIVGPPQVTLLGLEDEEYIDDLRADFVDAVMDAVASMSKAIRADDEAVKNAIMQMARRFLKEAQGKKPVIEVHLMRV